MTKPKVLRDLNDDELEAQLTDSKQELFNLRFQLATGKQDNSARLGQVRKDVARILTILREREIDAAETAEREIEAAGVADREVDAAEATEREVPA